SVPFAQLLGSVRIVEFGYQTLVGAARQYVRARPRGSINGTAPSSSGMDQAAKRGCIIAASDPGGFCMRPGSTAPIDEPRIGALRQGRRAFHGFSPGGFAVNAPILG